MIKIIAGEKGTGKTARLVDDINTVATQDNNVVCIERGNRLDQLLKPNVRLVNMKEYPISGYDQLFAFILGICSKDYDLTHIYIDSIYKVADNSSIEDMASFTEKLDAFLKDSAITATLVWSGKTEDLPENIKAFC
ncbi:MAG: twitching motility protein PilT [Clostridiales bacterium]|nr:twitching motility protein PilT [Clostridiales bacterium]